MCTQEINTMATTATIPAPGSLAAMPIKNETVNFAVIVKMDENGKIIKARHSSNEKAIAKVETGANKEGEIIAFKQAVLSPSVGTFEGFEQLVPDADERLNIINRGIGTKFNQKIRTTLLEQDEAGNLAFQPVEPIYDATSLVAAAAERTNLSPTDKAMKVLGALDPEVLAKILAQFSAIGK